MNNFRLQKPKIWIFDWWVKLWKLTSNKKILSGVVILIYNQVCCQPVSKVYWKNNLPFSIQNRCHRGNLVFQC